MDFGSGRAIEIAPFHSRGSLKGFVVSGRWPDSTKEWAQLLMAAVATIDEIADIFWQTEKAKGMGVYPPA